MIARITLIIVSQSFSSITVTNDEFKTGRDNWKKRWAVESVKVILFQSISLDGTG